ncbi:hypothetical protein BDP27DRAFT_1320363 [Rhodocollybia butyracea]|uniref:Uncharacterized protein n=1 Tax=Rhodocollybia butyracea TaxID=206335 RepID=A0A9P5PU15_9AGAR|nr:hypothetical protein BDP27DRAFT_1320363 [Rhodocollybia butyracea]
MSLFPPTRFRPLDPLLLDDGLASGSSISSAPVFGSTPESAMVNEIFNNPDAWSVQVGDEGNSAGPGLNSGNGMSSALGKGKSPARNVLEDSHDQNQASGSSVKSKKSSKSVRHPEGYHLKRKSKLQLEAFTLKPFESRHRVTPYLSSASSSEVDEGKIDSLSLERMSILWSHQNIFRAFPTPTGGEFNFRGDSPITSSQPSSASVGPTLEEAPVMKPRRNVPSLTISTTTTMTTTTMTTIITVQSPENRSPPSVTVMGASATWSILELYGDSPKPSPGMVVPKTSGHVHNSFKQSDLQFPSNPPTQQLNPGTPRIVELPADFVIPRRISNLKGPRMAPQTPTKVSMVKEPSTPQLPARSPRNRKSGTVRPLPKVPRRHSPPPPMPSLHSASASKLITSPPPPPVPPLHPVSTSKLIPAAEATPNPKPKDPLPKSRIPRSKKSVVRNPPPPPLPLDDPLPPLPVEQTPADDTTKSVQAEISVRPPPPPPYKQDLITETPLPPLPTAENPEGESTQTKVINEHVSLPPPHAQKSKVPTEEASSATVKKAKVAKENVPTVIIPQDKSLSKPLEVPSRPSRKNVTSPLPSPILQRINQLESVPGGPVLSVLSPPSSPGQKPTDIGPLVDSAPGDLLSAVPSAQLSARKSLRKSVSIASIPDVVLPDPSVLAKRVRKNSAPAVRPPFNDEPQAVVTPAPAVQTKVVVAPLVVSKPSDVPSSNGIKKIAAEESLSSQESSAKLEFPSMDRNTPSVPQRPSPAPSSYLTLRAPASPSIHRKGASLNSFETKPIVNGHKKSASSVSIKPTFADPPLPGAATLAKRLAARKNSTSGFRPPYPGVTRDSLTKEDRPHISSTTSDPTIPTRYRKESSRSPSPASKVPILRSTSDMVIPYRVDEPSPFPDALQPRNSHTKTPSTASFPKMNELVSSLSIGLKKIGSNSSLRSGGFSPAPDSATVTRSRNGSISMRRPMMNNDVVLPDRSVLAQRMQTPSALNRPYSDTSDAFTPSTTSSRSSASSTAPQVSTAEASIPLAAPKPTKPIMSLAAKSFEPAIPLAAPKPMTASGAWVPQLAKSITETVVEVQSALPGAVAHIEASKEMSRALLPRESTSMGPRGRSGSVSGARAMKPSPSVSSRVSRDPPTLQVRGQDSTSRTPSPSILVRHNTSTASSSHIRFRSIDKHPLPSMSFKGEEAPQPEVRRRPSAPERREHTESSRGRQPTPRTTNPPAEVVSPRGRSVSVARSPSVPKQPSSARRSASVAASPKRLPYLPPPLPLGSAGIHSPSESLASALSRGRTSPFPSRPVSRASTVRLAA